MGVPCAGTLLGSCCPLRFQSVCGGTHARDASLRADCRSGEDGFIEGPTPFGRRLRQKAPRDRVPSSAHAVRFASRAPVGVPAPGSLRSVSGVALVRAASLEGVCPMEDDFSRFSPPASREAKGAEVSADESITACGCEEVDAAVPLAGRGVPRLVYEDASSSPFGRRWPKRDPARRRTTPSWHEKASIRRRSPFTPPGNC